MGKRAWFSVLAAGIVIVAALALPAIESPAADALGDREPLRAQEPLGVVHIPVGQELTKQSPVDFELGQRYELAIDGIGTLRSKDGSSFTEDAFWIYECTDGTGVPDSPSACRHSLPREYNPVTLNGQSIFQWSEAFAADEPYPTLDGSHVYRLTSTLLDGRMTFGDSSFIEASAGATGVWTIEIFGPAEKDGDKRVVSFSVNQAGPAINARPGSTSSTNLRGEVAFKKIKSAGTSEGTIKKAFGHHEDVSAAGGLGGVDPTEVKEGFDFQLAAEPKKARYSVNGKGKKTLELVLGVTNITLPGTDCYADGADNESLRVVLKDDGTRDTLDFEPGLSCTHNEKFKTVDGQPNSLRVGVNRKD